MSDEGQWCDPGYCQLAEVSNYAKELKEKLAECLERNALLEARLGKAVKVLTKIAKYDHQAAAMRVLSLKDEQPFAMHLAPTPHPTKDLDTAVLLMDVASTDIAGWAAVTLAEIKSGIATTPYGLEGESHE